MSKYKKEFTIPYYDCDMSASVRAGSLLKYLNEVSSIHSDSLGMGAEESIANNYAWILNRWRVSFDTYPKAQETISIETWPSEFYKFYANRDFAIYDNKQEKIGQASSLWLLIDTKRGRPIRITDKIYNADHIVAERSFKDFSEIDESFEIDQSMEFRVRKTDIDYNQHVNNVKYLDWILEVIPEKIEREYRLKEFEIFYKKEVKYRDRVISGIDKFLKSDASNENIIEYNHKIIDCKTGELKTLGKSLWKKRT